MYIVAIAWIFVVVLMAAAEATSTQGSVLGALITLLLYGVVPLSVVLYLMATPARRRAQQRAQLAADAAAAPTAAAESAPSGSAPVSARGHPPAPGSADAGDRRGHAPGSAVAPEREEP